MAAGTCWIIWSRKEQRQVPTPATKFASQADADAFARRIVSKGGNTKDKQTDVFDSVQMNTL